MAGLGTATQDDAEARPRRDESDARGDARPSIAFIRVGSFYVSSSLSPLRAFWMLWQQQHEFLGDEGKGRRMHGARRAGRGLLRRARGLARAAGWTFSYLRGRSAVRRGGVGLELPIDGDLAIERRSGAVKVLDLERQRVATVMADPRSRRKLRERVEQVRRIEHHPFAPRITDVALERGWFAEAFVQGTHPTGFRGCGDDFGDVYLPLLVALALAEPPSHEQIGRRAERLAGEILAPEGLLQRLEQEPRDRVRAFVTEMQARVAASPAGGDTLPLVLSHGDFFSGNVVMTPDGTLQAIDWAHVGKRSPLHDLYYLAINHCGRVLPSEQLPSRIEVMLESFRQGLEAADARVFHALQSGLGGRAEERWLFYLECISVPLARCSDPGDRYIAAMLERVESFEALERAHGQALR